MSYYKVSYDKLFPYAAFLNERIGIEILVETSQDPMDALEEARKIVHNFRNKHIQVELAHQYEPATEKIPDIQLEKNNILVDYDTVIEEINKCETISDLDGWNFIAKGNHKAGMAFAKRAAFLLSPDNKKKQLTEEEVKQIMSKTNASSKLKQLKKLKP